MRPHRVQPLIDKKYGNTKHTEINRERHHR